MDAATPYIFNLLAPPPQTLLPFRTIATSTRTSTPIWKPKLLTHYDSTLSLLPISKSNITTHSTNRDVAGDPIPAGSGQTENPTVIPDSNSPATNDQLGPLPCSRKPSPGLIFDLGNKNSWDSEEIGSPVIRRYLSDDEERWYMWYHGRGHHNSDCIGLALSSNGVHWERSSGSARTSDDVGLVMHCSSDWWAFDTENIRPSDVSIMSSNKVRNPSGVYWLYYSGFSSEKVEFDEFLNLAIENPDRVIGNRGGVDGRNHVFRSLPGLAISQDARHWARIEGEHHSGALFDVGAEGEWDSLFIAAPQVVYHRREDLRMYYHSFDVKCGCFAVGIARSRDGIRWVKLGKILGGGSPGCFDEFGITNKHVVRNKDAGYLMVYEGVAVDGRRSIGLAESADGLKNWRRCGDEAILQPSEDEDGWDNKGVGFPCLVQMDGDNEWRLYYRGIGKEGRTGIGLAVSQGTKIRSFRRWTGFHL